MKLGYAVCSRCSKSGWVVFKKRNVMLKSGPKTYWYLRCFHKTGGKVSSCYLGVADEPAHPLNLDPTPTTPSYQSSGMSDTSQFACLFIGPGGIHHAPGGRRRTYDEIYAERHRKA